MRAVLVCNFAPREAASPGLRAWRLHAPAWHASTCFACAQATKLDAHLGQALHILPVFLQLPLAAGHAQPRCATMPIGLCCMSSSAL